MNEMLPDVALKSMNVMFATPCYISAVAMNYVASIFSLTCDSMHLGLRCVLHLHSESLITRGRNKMVMKFLAEEQYTHLFWIDSDIAFEPPSVFRLLLADRDVAAAGATSAARSGSISIAGSAISASTCSAATSPKACACRGDGSDS